MTQTEMIKRINDLGLTARVKDGEIRVNFKNGKEETAYYTTDRQDAVDTAAAMAGKFLTVEAVVYHTIFEYEGKKWYVPNDPHHDREITIERVNDDCTFLHPVERKKVSWGTKVKLLPNQLRHASTNG